MLDRMTPCQCGHPVRCHDTFIPHPDFVSQEETPDVSPYVLGEPAECNVDGYDCDCEVFVLHPYRDQMAAMREKWGSGRIGGGRAYRAAMTGTYDDDTDYSPQEVVDGTL